MDENSGWRSEREELSGSSSGCAADPEGSPDDGQLTGCAEVVRGWLMRGDWMHLSPLGAVLDADLLFGCEGLEVETLRPLFEVWWPAASLDQILEEQVRAGTLVVTGGKLRAASTQLAYGLASELGQYARIDTIHLPSGAISFERLMDGFCSYLQDARLGTSPQADDVAGAWGVRCFRSADRRNLFVLRPFPVWLHPHQDAYTLMVCQLPDVETGVIASQFSHRPALRHRLAMYDLERGHKINLTRSELFVYFERYLRELYGLRMFPSPSLTRSLMSSGLLNLNKG